jgi:hypothetical protein
MWDDLILCEWYTSIDDVWGYVFRRVPCVFVWSILRWSWDRTVVFFNHSPPIWSRLSSFRRYQSLVKVDEIAPLWYCRKDLSIFILSFFLEIWHAHKRSCFSHHSSVSSNSEIPSSVMSLRSLPLRGMCSLYHFASPISSARHASIYPAFWRNRFRTVLVHVVDLVCCPTFHR